MNPDTYATLHAPARSSPSYRRTGIAVAAVPTGLLRVPAVRRLSVPARALVTGLATCAIAVGLMVWAAGP